MLSLAQTQRVRMISDTQPRITDASRLELNICNAFAIVAVIEFEIVAVVTNRSDKDTLKVIISSHSDSTPSAKSSTPLPSKFKRKIFQFGLAPNTRKPEQSPPASAWCTPPTITNVEIATPIGLEDDEAVWAYANKYW